MNGEKLLRHFIANLPPLVRTPEGISTFKGYVRELLETLKQQGIISGYSGLGVASRDGEYVVEVALSWSATSWIEVDVPDDIAR